MDGKPFEILAECEMPAFPTGADIARVMDQIESARRSRPEVVRTTVNPPAIYRERRYVLPTRLVVWAEDAAGALRGQRRVVAQDGDLDLGPLGGFQDRLPGFGLNLAIVNS